MMPHPESASQTSPEIHLEDLSVSFGRKVVLDAVSHTFHSNSATCLVGLSASGKTVLAKTVAGLIQPTRGRVSFDAFDLTNCSAQTRADTMRRIGFLFQKSGLFDSLPIWINIAFQQLQNKTWTQTQAKQEAITLLARVGLQNHVADLFPADLSGGMQKRVGVARALAGAPDILILDEPTAGLDPIMSRAICDLVADLRTERPMTVIAISSDMEVAQRIGEDIAFIHNQGIEWSGPSSTAATSGHPAVEQIMNSSAEGPLSLL